MKRKKKVAKGVKDKKRGRNLPSAKKRKSKKRKSVVRSPPAAQVTLKSEPPVVVLWQIARVEAAMASLPPDALAVQDRKELTSALTVLKADPTLKTPRAREKRDRVQRIFDAMVVQGGIESGKAAVENWPAFLERLQGLIELIGKL
jgi:hypothetical protein